MEYSQNIPRIFTRIFPEYSLTLTADRTAHLRVDGAHRRRFPSAPSLRVSESLSHPPPSGARCLRRLTGASTACDRK
eukprot:4752465-Pyramimonas_sp.AAC.1